MQWIQSLSLPAGTGLRDGEGETKRETETGKRYKWQSAKQELEKASLTLSRSHVNRLKAFHLVREKEQNGRRLETQRMQMWHSWASFLLKFFFFTAEVFTKKIESVFSRQYCPPT